jgi:hypothetical protein
MESTCIGYLRKEKKREANERNGMKERRREEKKEKEKGIIYIRKKSRGLGSSCYEQLDSKENHKKGNKYKMVSIASIYLCWCTSFLEGSKIIILKLQGKYVEMVNK